MIGGTSDPTLQVMAERPDTRQLELGDCEPISRRVSRPRRSSRRRDPIEGSLPARSQLARHRPAADPPQGLSPTGPGTRRASSSRAASRARKQVSGTLEGVEGEHGPHLDRQGRPRDIAVHRHRVGQAGPDRQADRRHRAARHRGRRLIKTERNKTHGHCLPHCRPPPTGPNCSRSPTRSRARR